MNKIQYNKITIDDNLVLVVQALIDKQGDIIDRQNKLNKFIEGLRCLGEKQGIVK